MGNSMQHVVADPEPLDGDAQSFRRRGMRVRSWKEAFKGWNFSQLDEDAAGDYHYVWWDFVNDKRADYNATNPFGNDGADGPEKMPPDFYEAADSVWTPPVAIDLNGGAVQQTNGYNTLTGFGQYGYGQFVSGDVVSGDAGEDEVRVYNGIYENMIYNRLSVLRPWRDTLPNQTTPIFGLYAVRGWDFGTSRYGSVYDKDNTSRRFLKVFQGMRIPYKPSNINLHREPSKPGKSANSDYSAKRDRVIGFIFWGADINVYDSWISEGFSPREVRAILGLRDGMTDAEVRDTYVGAASGKPTVEADGFYVPIE
jgi:hypothetical protein